MRIELRDAPFDPWVELAGLTASRPDLRGKVGANAVFVGTMRDFNEGDSVESMFLEHYPGMTERELERLCRDCATAGKVLEVFVLHRIGRIEPGDDIVLVSVWAAHRAEAFGACREIMETLKHRAPFWKKERISGGERWVEKNTPG
ncbi:MAG: molybdenum cofactor biosynthesis protein MoaE [Proteobacteria bacterium]|nr:MAG: molybdenum cofactor biosynthesis protein MoaE [Pseudomonadota bacterium]